MEESGEDRTVEKGTVVIFVVVAVMWRAFEVLTAIEMRSDRRIRSLKVRSSDMRSSDMRSSNMWSTDMRRSFEVMMPSQMMMRSVMNEMRRRMRQNMFVFEMMRRLMVIVERRRRVAVEVFMIMVMQVAAALLVREKTSNFAYDALIWRDVEINERFYQLLAVLALGDLK